MAKRKKRKKRTPAQTFVDRRRLHQAAWDVELSRKLLELYVSLGAEVLIENYGLTSEQAAEWAMETIRRAREQLNNEK